METVAIRTVAIGSDHAGYALKTAIADFLRDSGYEVTDVGTHSDDRVDYPHFAAAVAQMVVDGEVERGILVCGSGQGVSIAANKVPGARAGVVREVHDAEMLRKHNNANIACFGQQATDEETARSAAHAFLTTDFEGGRHQARVDHVAALDRGDDVCTTEYDPNHIVRWMV